MKPRTIVDLFLVAWFMTILFVGLCFAYAVSRVM